MENDDAMLADEGEAVRDEGLSPAELPQDEPETIEVEVDGEVYILPAALKGALLRQADYTRKTQELAEHRRAVEAEREALAHHRRGLDDSAGDRATLAALDRQLDELSGIDWEALADTDPRRAQALWRSFEETQTLRDEFALALSHHEERADLEAAREAAEAMAATGAQLREEIEGWSPEVAVKLVDYAQAFGVTLEELREAADPRLWKLLHKAWKADLASQDKAGAQAQALRPAVTVAGGGAGGGGLRDTLGTREWMRRRNDQVARTR